MGCVRSKNRSKDDTYSREEMEGHTGRDSRKSNESLTITVIWRRLSLFSHRGSGRKQSNAVRTTSSFKSPEASTAESPGLEQQPEEFTLPKLEEEEENR